MAELRRVALVVGNGEYEHASRLKAAAGDALAMGNLLKRLEFQCIEGYDCDYNEFLTKFEDFLSRIDTDTLALMYFSGHGAVSSVRENHLLPTDAEIVRQGDFGRVTFGVDHILEQMRNRAKASLIFLDACRDDPFGDADRNDGSKRIVAPQHGLAPVEGVQSRALGQALIAFAAAPGSVAFDSDGHRSPFTSALLNHMESPGASLGEVLTEVKNEVFEATGGKQEPWVNDGLREAVVLKRDDEKSEPKRDDDETKDVSSVVGGMMGLPNASIELPWTEKLTNNVRLGKKVIGELTAGMRIKYRALQVAALLLVIGAIGATGNAVSWDYCRIPVASTLNSCKEQIVVPFIPHSESARPILDLIANAESGGNYDAVQGSPNNVDNPPLTRMTIGEVLDWQNERLRQGGVTAVGAYQMLRADLLRVMGKYGLTGREKFDRALQDRIAMELIQARQFGKFVDFGISIEQMAENLSVSWASLPVLRPTRSTRGIDLQPGQSWYSNAETPPVPTSVSDFRAALASARRIDYFLSHPGLKQSDIRVEFQFAGYVRVEVESIRNALVAAGWSLGAADRDGRAAGKAEVRYSPDSDTKVAQLLADDLGAASGKAVEVKSNSEIRAPNLEVWIAQ